MAARTSCNLNQVSPRATLHGLHTYVGSLPCKALIDFPLDLFAIASDVAELPSAPLVRTTVLV